MDRVEAQISELTEAVQAMDLRLSALEKDMVIVKSDLGDIKRQRLEDDVRSQPRAYIRKSHLVSLRTLTYDEKYDLSESLEASDRSDLDHLDAILYGKRDDGTEAYVAVEASRTLEDHDLLRVLRRAKLLAATTGTLVLPLTVCSIPPDDRARRRALELNVAVARKNDGIILEAPYLAS